MCIIPFVVIAIAAIALAEEPLLAPVEDLTEAVPPDFPRLHLIGHDTDSSLLSRFLWHHFDSRRPADAEQTVLFNKEYLMISDLWMGGATARGGKPIQRAWGDTLLAIKLDPDGYVHTHQHFSHAHDNGWPFPLWTQAPDYGVGLTTGWHFQDDGPGWVWGYLKGWQRPEHYGLTATQGWELHNLRSEGLVEGKWHLVSTGESPALTTPAGVVIDAQNAPFLQLRWKRSGEARGEAYVEWLREGDTDFGPDRRVPITRANSDFEGLTGVTHCIMPMHEHPLWQGKIPRLRLALAPGESDVTFDIDSLFTVYDTRHSINNPIYILSAWRYFRWTGDIEFLRAITDRMRLALRYQQTAMGGLEHKHIRNPWVGHDGRPGYTVNADGSKTMHPGHGTGNNYWDLLPFGGHDMYATSQYYAATLALADIEEAIREHPDWGIAPGPDWSAPGFLRKHAAEVKRDANRRFWNAETDRFVGWIDLDGVAYDYGFTFVNLEAIWYGIANDAHAREIMGWLSGKRIIDGDTSTGADIYHWRFGPRATTKRNVEVYGQGWTAPESLPWGGQVQDGGAVLGFTFFDLWARLNTYGPDDAWQRLQEILKWEQDVWAAGGYREFYRDGKQGTTLQGGGTAGGIGIDFEFYETSMVPTIVVEGFLGIRPTTTALLIEPRLPSDCPAMGVSNLCYQGVRMDVRATRQGVAVEVKDKPPTPLRLRSSGRVIEVADTGRYTLPAKSLSPDSEDRLSSLSPSEFGDRRSRARDSVKAIILNDDGWSSYMRHPAPMSPREIERVTVEPLVGTGVVAYQFCALGGHAVNYRSGFLPRVGDLMERIDTLHVWRMRETLRHLDELGTDPLRIASEACHRAGIACQFSLRMNDAHHVYRKADGSPYFPELLSPWFDAHRDALLPGGQLDYAHPDVHEYRLAQIGEVLSEYDVDGIDLDFTRFRPWFREGEEEARAPLMTDLVRRFRDLTGSDRTLSARFEYDPEVCVASGLDVEHWLAEGLLDQITLGGIGDHTPDAPSDWWVERAHGRGCKVYPGLEGQLHWIASCGGGGTGLRPGNGVVDGSGPPSIEYMRAVAALHYMSGADGVSLFNFTCADGPWDPRALTELADPDALRFADKQYVLAVWPSDAQIYNHEWVSRFRMEEGETEASRSLRMADGGDHVAKVTLWLDLRGVNRIEDLEITLNGSRAEPTGYRYNHYDHGCWDEVVAYDVPAYALQAGANHLRLVRARTGFPGPVQVRKCVLDVSYPPASGPT